MFKKSTSILVFVLAVTLSLGSVAAGLFPPILADGKVLTPTSPKKETVGNSKATIDISNMREGYFAVTYLGSNQKIKVQVTKKGGTTYTYNLNARDTFEVFPASEGDGSYTIKVFENVSGTTYAQACSETIDVKLKNSYSPFLYPNQYVSFNSKSKAVAQGTKLCKGVKDELEKVQIVFDYVVDNFKYDYNKADTVQSGYLPNVDKVLSNKKGICFDYAAVMATMLRSQDVPTKLVVGYAGSQYHAWIDVYTKKKGWLSSVIYFDGKKWSLVDPTYASSSKRDKKIMKYIANPKNYSAKLVY